MSEDDAGNDITIFCARCGVELTPGSGNFYVVRIDAVADPTPPAISGEDLHRDHRAEIDRLIRQMRGMSSQELSDQVHRRLILHLCGDCYRDWIEDPVR